MKSILIIGGTKFIGRMLVDKFIVDGYKITVFSRSTPKQNQVNYIKGDRNNPNDLQNLIRTIQGNTYDRIYDMCCYEPDQAEKLAPILVKHTKKIILFSSAAVYEKSEIFPLNESSPLGEHPSFGDYGTKKAGVEAIYKKNCENLKVQLTIFRPHYILGVGDYFKRHEYIYSRIESNRTILMPGNGKALIQFAYAPDVVELFYNVPEKQLAPIECLNIASQELITLKGTLSSFSDSLKRKLHIVYLDYEKYDLHEDYFYDHLFPFPNLNLILDSTRAKQLYGYSDTPLKEYLPELAKDWKNKKSEYELVLSSYEKLLKPNQ